MSLFSILANFGKRATDKVVGVASGDTPLASLDNRSRAFQVVLTIGIVAFGMSGWLIYNSVVSATRLVKVRSSVNAGNTNTATAIAKLEQLKNTDTDNDGLSDYDELYNTHSSPYLFSSAGDGISDNEKIGLGLDPNCPQGKTCPGFRLLTSIVDQNGQLTPEFIRRSLQSAGVPQATLDQTDDATLLQIYRQVVGSATPTNTNAAMNANFSLGNTNGTSSISNTNTATSLEQIEQLTSAEIRQLLIQNGVDASTLNTVDDTTLKAIFQQAISSNTTNTNQ